MKHLILLVFMALVSPCLSAEPPQEVDWKSVMTVAPV